MTADPVFIVRLPSTNLETSVAYFKAQDFKVIAAEEIIDTVWIQKDSLIFSLCECAAEHPMLVMYFEKPDEFLKKIDQLSIVCNFAADHMGNHFEALFSDPGGLTIAAADIKDLPEECLKANFSNLYELAIPAVPAFTDSINFWNSLGFLPVPDGPRPHPWSRLQLGSMTIGIHQSADFQRPGLVFKESCPIENDVTISLDLKNCGISSVSETCDSTLIYKIP